MWRLRESQSEKKVEERVNVNGDWQTARKVQGDVLVVFPCFAMSLFRMAVKAVNVCSVLISVVLLDEFACQHELFTNQTMENNVRHVRTRCTHLHNVVTAPKDV